MYGMPRNIIADIHVIQNMEKDDPATADRWKTVFFSHVVTSLNSVTSTFCYFPRRGRQDMNILAIILLVKPWKLKPQESKDRIRTRCISILRAWSDSMQDIDNDFSLSPDLRKEYQFITNWYRKVEKECA
jgi:hypothetical protein